MPVLIALLVLAGIAAAAVILRARRRPPGRHAAPKGPRPAEAAAVRLEPVEDEPDDDEPVHPRVGLVFADGSEVLLLGARAQPMLRTAAVLQSVDLTPIPLAARRRGARREAAR